MKKTLLGIFILLATAYALHTTPALAQIPSPINPGLIEEIAKQGESAASIGFNLPIEALRESDIRFFLANLTKQLLAAVGVIFVAFTVYGGALWMTSQGEEEKIKKAKAMIVRASVGIFIILASYSIALFVERRLLDAVWKQAFYRGGKGDAEFEEYNKCVDSGAACSKELEAWQKSIRGN